MRLSLNLFATNKLMTCPSLQQLHLKTLFEEVELNSEKRGVKSNCYELKRPSQRSPGRAFLYAFLHGPSPDLGLNLGGCLPFSALSFEQCQLNGHALGFWVADNQTSSS